MSPGCRAELLALSPWSAVREGTAQPHLAAGGPRSARCSVPIPALPFSSLRDATLVFGRPRPLRAAPSAPRLLPAPRQRRVPTQLIASLGAALARTQHGHGARGRAPGSAAGSRARSEAKSAGAAQTMRDSGKRPAAAAEGRNPERVRRVWGRATAKGCPRNPGPRRHEPPPRVRDRPWQRERHRTAAGWGAAEP